MVRSSPRVSCQGLTVRLILRYSAVDVMRQHGLTPDALFARPRSGGVDRADRLRLRTVTPSADPIRPEWSMWERGFLGRGCPNGLSGLDKVEYTHSCN